VAVCDCNLSVLHRVISVDERAAVMERLQGFSSQVGGVARLACHQTHVGLETSTGTLLLYLHLMLLRMSAAH
jgi:hypothetical protein